MLGDQTCHIHRLFAQAEPFAHRTGTKHISISEVFENDLHRPPPIGDVGAAGTPLRSPPPSLFLPCRCYCRRRRRCCCRRASSRPLFWAGKQSRESNQDAACFVRRAIRTAWGTARMWRAKQRTCLPCYLLGNYVGPGWVPLLAVTKSGYRHG